VPPRPARRLPILTYHAVVDTARPSAIAVSPAQFAAQMRALAEAGYVAVPLSRTVEWLREPERQPLPERTIAITFDDGYRSVLETAAPILREHGFTATAFLVTGCGISANAPTANAPTANAPTASWQPPWPLLTWAEVEALGEAGFEFGAHTVTHPVLTHLPPGEAEREMSDAQQEIVRRTGQAAHLLAYPYGARSPAVEAIAKRYFDAACGTTLGLASPRSNLFNLERVDAYYLSPASLAARLESVPARGNLALRRGLRWVRRLVRQDWE
jgi:peptidoglycan/xylan/chitin deacetylase (PgdA/CDA1 family)